MTELSLDQAYFIRADATVFIEASLAAGSVSSSDVVAEIVRLHPGLDQAEADHLERRVTACWGQVGLDYEEAPLRADGLWQWYPVRRNGRLQRIPLPALTNRERDEIMAEMKGQAEHALARAAALQAAR